MSDDTPKWKTGMPWETSSPERRASGGNARKRTSNPHIKRRTMTDSQMLKKPPLQLRSFEDYDDDTEFDGLLRRLPSNDGGTHHKVAIPDSQGEDPAHPSFFNWRLFCAYTGPGWLMSVAYLDPGNIESDLQAGGYQGYQLLWVLLVSTVLGLLLQVLAARLGTVSGHNLAENCRHFYSTSESRILWLMTQIAIIGSDIQEIVGSAVAFRVLFGIPLWAGCLITGLDTLTFLAIHVAGVRKLEAVFAVLIFTMCICFFADFAYDPPAAGEIARGLFVPTVDEHAVIQAVSILGAIVMPHNIFLHSALVLSRDIDRNRPEKLAEANKYFAIEAAIALFVSLAINCAIVSVFAHGFYSPLCASVHSKLALVDGSGHVEPPFACVPYDGVTSTLGEIRKTSVECITASGNQGTCMPIGLQGAATALESLLGKSARVLWAIGLLAAGQSSTMTGTFAGQFVMEGFLHMQVPNWMRVFITRSISLVPATIVALLANSDSMAADRLDEWLNALQSVQLPFALLPLLHFTGSEEVMGDFANGPVLSFIGWSSALGVIVINIVLVGNFLFQGESREHESGYLALILTVAFLYFYMLWRIVRSDIIEAREYVQDLWRSRSSSSPMVKHHKSALDEDCGVEKAPFVNNYGTISST